MVPRRCVLLTTMLVFVMAPAVVLGLEHPGEHPGTEAAHQPEPAYSAEEIKTAIRKYITTDQQLKHGYFFLHDTQLERDWKLRFKNLHPVRTIQRDGQMIYFACTDFEVVDDPDHDLVDLDFWMVPEDGKLRPTRIRIHKVDGEARFTYEDDTPVPTNS